MGDFIDFKASTVKKMLAFNESNDATQQISRLIETNYAITEMYNIAKEKLDTDLQKQSKQIEHLKSENHALKATVGHLENNYKKYIPTHIALFLIIYAIIITLSTTFAILYYSMQLNIIGIYYVWCAFISSTTLFCTALRALVDWRKMFNEKQ